MALAVVEERLLDSHREYREAVAVLYEVLVVRNEILGSELSRSVRLVYGCAQRCKLYCRVAVVVLADNDGRVELAHREVAHGDSRVGCHIPRVVLQRVVLHYVVERRVEEAQR